MTAKRVVDLAIGLPTTLVAAPVVVACALWVLLSSGWPPLIRQERVGAGESRIHIYKIRTMRVGVPVLAKALVASGDVYARGGRFLRRWSLDELPQLLSVLSGDMSLVGPRPALPSQHDLLALRRRHGVTRLKPGLTGLAQITGRESLTLATKVRLETVYLRRQTVRFDLLILLRTAEALLSGRGAL